MTTTTTAITLVSAVAGDRVGRAVELAELGRPSWVDRPEVQEFFAECNYGPDRDWAELMYVLAEDEGAPAGFPALEVEVGADELAQIRKAFQGEDTATAQTTLSTATYHQAGAIDVTTTYPGGSKAVDRIGYYDADGGEWDAPVRAMLRAHGWEPVGEWAGDDILVRKLDVPAVPTVITTSVRNGGGAWEVIAREPGTSLDGAEVSAHDIGGEADQPLLIELRDADDTVLESVEIEAR